MCLCELAYILKIYSLSLLCGKQIKYIKHYEGLSYDRDLIKQQHQRIRRETHPNKQELHLNFNAFQREFHLRLKPDVNGFTEDFKVQSEDETQMVDLSHIYSGAAYCKQNCSI
uniref:Peptidase M12B propeptide domain-containing protein n=1 Tax=Sinocyclocheilus grahami TaxID=75366 RepID=A0A672KET7_SINGR